MFGSIKNKYNAPEIIYVIKMAGQSNCSGRAQWARAGSNNDYNYKGISDPVSGYPAVRGSRTKYVKNPPGCFIYYKGNDRTQNYTIDNGSWQALNAGVNTVGDSTFDFFGAEVSMATRIQEATGKEVFIIKASWGDTALNEFKPVTTWPNINNYYRTIDKYAYTERAFRDLKTFRPNAKIVFLGEFWWQGEADLSLASQYEFEWNKYQRFMSNILKQYVSVDRFDYKRIIVNLKYYDAANNAIMNNVFDTIAANNPGKVFTIDHSICPQKQSLSAAEASPIAVGSPNSTGANDDSHSSYISQFYVGEKAADIFLAA